MKKNQVTEIKGEKNQVVESRIKMKQNKSPWKESKLTKESRIKMKKKRIKMERIKMSK